MSLLLLTLRKQASRIIPLRPHSSFVLHSSSRSIALSLNSIRRFQHNQSPRRNPILRENVYTFPNLLTVSRIAACPALGWAILSDNYAVATGLLLYAGITDWLDGFLARKYRMTSILGTILDPAADKALVGTLVVTLTIQRLLPFPLAIVIVGRDLLLSLSAFYIRYTSLPLPKTFQRYWDFSIPSAEVRPTTISKVNTALQLVLMGSTTISPLLPGMAVGFGLYLEYLQWTVAMTTIWSGLSYVFSKDAVRILSNARRLRGPPSSL
ncbi:CDP-alcohol phosphatidyltransferase-domain-containing protein [Multifurca ochricompacta]|uniref:CDP-alcohol phosphatidyltransferase-domain-containing protein n=1 Tax=Multifurca ochricompacta TaxID=376703 RepID=A0AAD4QL70_9AGAM|nr:CDP-alcohol phosphatidyltransferase-domain-containing protein [Multifurca ochricompacta]